ncbi:hypothetical protein, partial [Actinomyces polynesiensis]|uniref:hypothetical protein n=1 Tax=Actinomyces polynesiensis TaxID=1325934 RepID=UPI001C9CEC47
CRAGPGAAGDGDGDEGFVPPEAVFERAALLASRRRSRPASAVPPSAADWGRREGLGRAGRADRESDMFPSCRAVADRRPRSPGMSRPVL